MSEWQPIEAPFTPEQVAHINEFQQAGLMHPFTCPGHGGGGSRDLVAAEEGLRCPSCDYRQNWVHDFMANGEAVKSLRQMRVYRALTAITPGARQPVGGKNG